MSSFKYLKIWTTKKDKSKSYYDKCASTGKDIFVKYACSWFEKVGQSHHIRIDETKYNEYSQMSICDLYKISIEKNDHWAIKLAKKCEDILREIKEEGLKFEDVLEKNRRITFEKLGLK